MLTPSGATVRLFLHVIAATVWVGGQLTLAGLVPGLRAIDPRAQVERGCDENARRGRARERGIDVGRVEQAL